MPDILFYLLAFSKRFSKGLLFNKLYCWITKTLWKCILWNRLGWDFSAKNYITCICVLTSVLMVPQSQMYLVLTATQCKSSWRLPSASRQSVWCCPPEKSTQEVVEFLKQVSFTGTKHILVLLVPKQIKKKKKSVKQLTTTTVKVGGSIHIIEKD